MIFKVKPGCAQIAGKLVSDNMNGINTNNIHCIVVKFLKDMV